MACPKRMVSTRTRMSLLGAVFTSFTKGLHWHMLYATIKSIAAMQGMGISAARGMSTSRTSRSTIA